MMHFVQLRDNLRRERDVFHDPLTLELVNKKQELLSGRKFQRSKQIHDEKLVGVRMFPCLRMNLYEEGHHASHQKMDVVLVGMPQNNSVKLLLKMSNFYDHLRLQTSSIFLINTKPL